MRNGRPDPVMLQFTGVNSPSGIKCNTSPTIPRRTPGLPRISSTTLCGSHEKSSFSSMGESTDSNPRNNSLSHQIIRE